MQESQKTTETERRQSARFLPREGVTVVCRRGTLGLGRDLALSLLDVSDVGARLALGDLLSRGDVVEVGLAAPDWPGPIARVGVVVWSKEADDGSCQIGVVFSRGLAASELRDLCQPIEV